MKVHNSNMPSSEELSFGLVRDLHSQYFFSKEFSPLRYNCKFKILICGWLNQKHSECTTNDMASSSSVPIKVFSNYHGSILESLSSTIAFTSFHSFYDYLLLLIIFSFFVFQSPMYVPANSDISIHFWRKLSRTKVWYEWCIVHGESSTNIHNANGRSYFIGL